MNKKFCDVCEKEIVGISYAVVYGVVNATTLWVKKEFPKTLDVCSFKCLKKFVSDVDDGIKTVNEEIEKELQS